MQVQIQRDTGLSFGLEHIKSEIKKDLNKEDVAKVTVVREDLETEIQEGDDELVIRDENGTKQFGGVIKDIDRKNALVEFFVESYERYARDATPVPAGFSFTNATDDDIAVAALQEIDKLAHASNDDGSLIRQLHKIEQTETNLEMTYHHTSPARVLRKLRDVTSAEIQYQPDKTIKYVNELGSDKTGTTISPRKRNVSEINVKRKGGDEKATHLRMLGAGSGSSQITATVIADQYDPGSDREIWTTEVDESISNSNTLAKEANRILEERYEVTTDIIAVVRREEVNIGDYYTIDYPQEEVNNRELRAVKVNQINDREGERYKVTFSNVHQDRKTKDQEQSERVEQMSREEDQIVGLPIYTEVGNAPERLGVIYISGEGSSERGIYTWNPDVEQFERGSNADLADLSNRDLDGNDLMDEGFKVYDASTDEINGSAFGDIPRNKLPSEIGNIDNYPLLHGTDVNAPADAHHSPPDVDVGILECDPANAPDYVEYVNTSFRPQYIEFYTQYHRGNIGSIHQEPDGEIEENIITGSSQGYGHGDQDSEQVVAMEMRSPGLQEGNKTYVDYGYVGYISAEEDQGAGNYATETVSLQIYSILNNGFRVVWTDNDFATPVIYRAFK